MNFPISDSKNKTEDVQQTSESEDVNDAPLSQEPLNREFAESYRIKRQQWQYLLILSLGLVILLSGSYAVMNHHHPLERSVAKQTTLLTSPFEHIDAQSIWMEHAQNELTQSKQQLQAYQQQLQLLQQAYNEQNKTQQQQFERMQTLQTQVDTLKSTVQQQTNENTHHDPISDSPLQLSSETAGISPKSLFPSKIKANLNQFQCANTNRNDLFLNDKESNLIQHKTKPISIPDKNPKTYVPAGTFVRAILLGGADASTSVNSQANPSPMLLRILDQGTLPNHRHSYLKNCVATAAVIGDISSERGEIRLENLSCVQANNEIVDTPVEATVFGPDGKNAVRGKPVWRERALLQRAMLAGTLSGLSEGISQYYTANTVSPWGNVQSVDNTKVMQYGLAHGVSNALDKLADYHIRRAEQYHPVIQLSAGTVVDVVFLKGFYLDGKVHDSNAINQTISFDNTVTENVIIPEDTVSVLDNPSSSLPLTPHQIALLKQRITH